MGSMSERQSSKLEDLENSYQLVTIWSRRSPAGLVNINQDAVFCEIDNVESIR
jgi:hypothetical protein